MIRNRKKTWALFLSAALIMTQLPAVALAENSVPENGTVASFAPLDNGVANQTVDVGTEISGLNLPDKVTAMIYHVTEDTEIPEETDTEKENDDTSTAVPGDAEGSAGDPSEKDSVKTVMTVTTSGEEIPVTWDSEPSYDGDVEGSYLFTANVSGYALSSGVKPPAITVTVTGETMENPGESETEEPLPCTENEGCTLAEGHEGECVIKLSPANDGLTKTISSWTFADDENLNEGVLAMPGVTRNNQADFNQVVSLLPTRLSAVVEGEADPAVLDIAGWDCPEYTKDGGGNWPLNGDYIFTAKLPEGYTCEPSPTVRVLPGGGSLYANEYDGLTITGDAVTQGTDGQIRLGNGAYEISGTWNKKTFTDVDYNNPKAVITVPSGVTSDVTFDNVAIAVISSSGAKENYICAFAVEAGATANIRLSGANILTSGGLRAGLEVTQQGKVTIDGTGSLTSSLTSSGYRGIGGYGGIIEISGGTVTAEGEASGAGITGEIVKISGGMVTANGGDGDGAVAGGAGIGGNCTEGGGIVEITGGTVIANGNGSAAGIGGGGYDSNSASVVGGSGGTVKISGEGTSVTAISVGYYDAFDVGSGYGNGEGGSLSVTDGATLILADKGTNVKSPVYINCTIIDNKGNDTYYPLKTPALSLTAAPEKSLALPGTVTLTAALSDAYPDNLDKTITFTVNGREAGTAVTDNSGKAVCSITDPPQGNCTFGASCAGDKLNKKAEASINDYLVIPIKQAALNIDGLGGSYTYGREPFTISASGGSGNGGVSFKSGDSSVAEVTGNTVTIIKAGTFTISATKAADSRYDEATVTSGAVTVREAIPDISLTASGGGSTGTPMILTASVSKAGAGRIPSGTVTFSEGGSILKKNVPLDASGKAVYTIDSLSAGKHTYTAAYSGQPDYYKDTSATLTITEQTSPAGGDVSSSGSSSYTAREPQNLYTIAGGTINLTLSRSVLMQLADSGKRLTLCCDKAGMAFAPAALKAILAAVPQAAGNITFTAVPVDISAYPDAAAQIGSRPVYDFTISYRDSSGKTVTVPMNFPAGSASVSLNYTPAATEVTGSLFMVCVDGEGTVTWLDKSSYANGRLWAEVPHFSIFGTACRLPAPVFADITAHWAKEEMEFAAARGLLSGTGKNLFSPDGAMTRGMFAAALGRLAGVNPDSWQSRSFADVKADSYYAPYVEWAAQKNIIRGTGDKRFSPDDPVTREQMAVIMADYAGQMGYSIPSPLAAVKFADDGKISPWAAEDVAVMQRAGIVKGKDGNLFDPQANATRAEGSATLRRFVEIVIDPALAQGWIKNDSGRWLYYKDGKAITGWREIDGKRRYFDENGVMAVNAKIDGYEIGPDGAKK